MGTISRYNSVQFENLNANELVGVTLVYKSVNRQANVAAIFSETARIHIKIRNVEIFFFQRI